MCVLGFRGLGFRVRSIEQLRSGLQGQAASSAADTGLERGLRRVSISFVFRRLLSSLLSRLVFFHRYKVLYTG